MSTITDDIHGRQTICHCHDLNTNFADTKPVCDLWQGDQPDDRCRSCGHWEACHVSPRRSLHHNQNPKTAR